jgi:hypothetical protein
LGGEPVAPLMNPPFEWRVRRLLTEHDAIMTK